MRPEDAEDIATTIKRTWPNFGISPEVFAEHISDLERAPAWEALRRMSRTAERAPTIASFRHAVQDLLGTARETDEVCQEETCGGTGWVTDHSHPAHWPGDPATVPMNPHEPDLCICNVVSPCPRCNRNFKRPKASAA